MLDLNSLSLQRQTSQDCTTTETRYCLFAAGEVVTRVDQHGSLIAWFSKREIESNFSVVSSINIGRTDQCLLFAANTADDVALPEHFNKSSLLNFMLHEPEQDAQLIGRAAQLLNWQDSHKFCGKCSQALRDTLSEYAMACDACNTTTYPRISPCIITLVTNEKRMLLATNSQVHGKWYSTLAGFVEPGESLEQALAREVLEEVGITVKNITYFSSQPWPFPAQLMIGFFAEYAGGDITPDGVEIEHADWFEAGDLPKIPGKFSIAGKLIHHFIGNS